MFSDTLYSHSVIFTNKLLKIYNQTTFRKNKIVKHQNKGFINYVMQPAEGGVSNYVTTC